MNKKKLIVVFLGVAAAVPVLSALRSHAHSSTPLRREAGASTVVQNRWAELPKYTLARRDDFRRNGDPFFDRMNLVEDDFRPLELREALDKSVTVVTGTIESISDGRVMDFVRGPSHPTYTAVLKVKVSGVQKENAKRGRPEYVYVETIRAPFVKPQELERIKPRQEVTLFLREAHQNLEVEKYTASGIPDGEPLYALTTPQGMLVSTEDGLYTQPLSDMPILAPEIDTFDEVKEAVSDPERAEE